MGLHRSLSLRGTGQPGPLSASHTSSPATPPVSFPPSKSLQNLTTVTRSAAATLHGHRLMLTAFHSSEKHNHTVVCRALCSLVPAGSLQCPLLLPSLLRFSLMGLRVARGHARGAPTAQSSRCTLGVKSSSRLIPPCAQGTFSGGLSCPSPAGPSPLPALLPQSIYHT